MKMLHLTKGMFAVIDDADAEWAKQFRWHASQSDKNEPKFYARRGDGKYLHRLLAAVDGLPHVDHKNGFTLDCQRENLRPCTVAQNVRAFKSPYAKGKKSCRFRGVSWFKRDKCWRAYLMLNGRQLHLGYFKDKEKAARAYDKAARQHFGEFAAPNFPDEQNVVSVDFTNTQQKAA